LNLPGDDADEKFDWLSDSDRQDGNQRARRR
jgi:hypothetical protein